MIFKDFEIDIIVNALKKEKEEVDEALIYGGCDGGSDRGHSCILKNLIERLETGKKKYGKQRKCPFCEGTDLAVENKYSYVDGDLQSSTPNIFVTMSCENCGKDWFDIYQLVDVVRR